MIMITSTNMEKAENMIMIMIMKSINMIMITKRANINMEVNALMEVRVKRMTTRNLQFTLILKMDIINYLVLMFQMSMEYM